MKVGSIVECIDGEFSGYENLHLYTPPIKGKIYTIRNILPPLSDRYYTTTAHLEEIINQANPYTGIEGSFFIGRFRELLPPMEIQEALDECEPVLIELNK